MSLSDAAYAELFSTAGRARPDYERLAGTERLYDYRTGRRWTERAAVLWETEHPP